MWHPATNTAISRQLKVAPSSGEGEEGNPIQMDKSDQKASGSLKKERNLEGGEHLGAVLGDGRVGMLGFVGTPGRSS